MNQAAIPVEYANSLLYELEKAFWDERGRGARFRVTTVGREYWQRRCLSFLQSADLEGILRAVDEALRVDAIVDGVSYDREERLLRVRVAGCVHRPVEERLVACGAEPFTCVPANLIALAVEEKLDRPVELAEIKLDEEGCQLLLVLFDKRPVLG
jgi:hypothetical protein